MTLSATNLMLSGASGAATVSFQATVQVGFFSRDQPQPDAGALGICAGVVENVGNSGSCMSGDPNSPINYPQLGCLTTGPGCNECDLRLRRRVRHQHHVPRRAEDRGLRKLTTTRGERAVARSA